MKSTYKRMYMERITLSEIIQERDRFRMTRLPRRQDGGGGEGVWRVIGGTGGKRSLEKGWVCDH